MLHPPRKLVIFWEEYWEKWVYRVKKGTDVYAFGAPQPGRNFNSTNYSYGFNGQEKDDEVATGIYTAEFWEYDSRIGRRWNTDPVVYPWQSPYATFNNNPIYFADPSGLEGTNDPPKKGDQYDCGGGKSETFDGTQYIPNQPEVVINGNPNSINNITYKDQNENPVKVQGDLANHLASKINGYNDPNKFSWKYIPNPSKDGRSVGFMGLNHTFNEQSVYGSYYELSYDGNPIGSFQVKGDRLMYDGNINYDATGELPWAISIYGAGSGANFTDIIMDGLSDEMMGINKPSMKSSVSADDKFRFATFPNDMNASSKEWAAWRSSQGLSYSQAKPFYDFYKKNGYVTMQNGKPVIKAANQISVKVNVGKTVTQAMSPAKNVVVDKSNDAGKKELQKK